MQATRWPYNSSVMAGFAMLEQFGIDFLDILDHSFYLL